jgi:hypothetical protein
MLTSLLALLLATQAPSTPTRDALVRAVLVHVRDASTSFDTEADPAHAPWFDSQYTTVFVSCGDPPGVTVTPPRPIPCSFPKDLLGSRGPVRATARTLRAVPKQAANSINAHAFTFYIQDIDPTGSTADVSVYLRYASYFCSGTYHMRFHEGSWRVAGAELAVIS